MTSQVKSDAGCGRSREEAASVAADPRGESWVFSFSQLLSMFETFRDKKWEKIWKLKGKSRSKGTFLDSDVERFSVHDLVQRKI